MNNNFFRLMSWNVNSLRMREMQLFELIEQKQPDVICLQEIKMEDVKFPQLEFINRGYQTLIHGQKSYNGVALLVKKELGRLEEIQIGIGPWDQEARFISVYIQNLKAHIACVYVPNGQEILSPKFTYKLNWLEKFQQHLQNSFQPGDDWILAGDFNIAPIDLDVYDPKRWADTVICHQEVRRHFENLEKSGFVDVVRAHHQNQPIYTYWDYRHSAFDKNYGLRIDHILATHSLAKRCISVSIEKELRKKEKPSDHVPIIADFDRLLSLPEDTSLVN